MDVAASVAGVPNCSKPANACKLGQRAACDVNYEETSTIDELFELVLLENKWLWTD